jgi:hypothetical protein
MEGIHSRACGKTAKIDKIGAICIRNTVFAPQFRRKQPLSGWYNFGLRYDQRNYKTFVL